MPAVTVLNDSYTTQSPPSELAENPGKTVVADGETEDLTPTSEPGHPETAPVGHEVETAARALERELDELRIRHDDLARCLIEREARLAKLEQAYKQAHVERELVAALAGQPLVDGAIRQLVKLWRDDLDSREEGGELRVVSRDGQPLGAAVASWLDQPEYAHFTRPRSFGGSAQPGNRGAYRSDPAEPVARNLGESVIQQWQRAAAQAGEGQTPIGLHRRRR